MGTIRVLKSCILMETCNLEVHILCRLLHADHAIPFLALKSFSEEDIKEPRYLSSSLHFKIYPESESGESTEWSG